MVIKHSIGVTYSIMAIQPLNHTLIIIIIKGELIMDTNIFQEIQVGDYLAVKTVNYGLIGGWVKQVFHMKNLSQKDDYYTIRLEVGTDFADVVVHNEEEIISAMHEDGDIYYNSNKDSTIIAQYGIDPRQSNGEIIEEISDRWKDLCDTGKEDIASAIKDMLEVEDIKNIFNVMSDEKCQIINLADKIIQANGESIRLSKRKTEFLERFTWLKDTLPDGVGKIYNFILYDLLGLEWLTEVD